MPWPRATRSAPPAIFRWTGSIPSCRSTRWSATFTTWKRFRCGPVPKRRSISRTWDTSRTARTVPTGYALVNGRRSVYILVTKRADASTLSVVNAVKAALPDMQAVLPPDIHVSYEFDQSPYVTRAIWGVVERRALGAVLVGLMILLFLRDWRSTIIVLLNIPLALMAAVVALWLTGQTINLMTLGGLALAIGILVDEATVEIENIHTQMGHAPSIAKAVRLGNAQTAVPRLLAMVCILAVFISSFFMQGAPRAMFVPLSLAVGFSMVASYLLSSTFVPVLSVWLLASRASGRSARRPAAAGPAHSPVDLLALVGFGHSLRAVPPRLRAAAGADRPLPLGPCGRLSRRVCGDHLGTGLTAGHGDLPDHRHRAIPPPHPRPGRNGHRPDRAGRPEGPGGDQGDRRSGQRADDPGLPGHDPLRLPDQHRVINGCAGRRTP